MMNIFRIGTWYWAPQVPNMNVRQPEKGPGRYAKPEDLCQMH